MIIVSVFSIIRSEPQKIPTMKSDPAPESVFGLTLVLVVQSIYIKEVTGSNPNLKTENTFAVCMWLEYIIYVDTNAVCTPSMTMYTLYQKPLAVCTDSLASLFFGP